MNCKNPGMPIEISVLANAVHYRMQRVFIAAHQRKYRLIVYNDDRVVTDIRYPSAKSARIAFLKLWGFRREDSGAGCYWSGFKAPEEMEKWLSNFKELDMTTGWDR